MSPSRTQTRLGALALAAGGALLVLYPVTRPWADESTLEGARQSMGSDAWVLSHFFGMLGFILVPMGLLAIAATVQGTRAKPWAAAMVVTGWLGSGLVLPYFGAEDFGLNAIARAAAQSPSLELLSLVEGVRFNAWAISSFAAGLMALGTSAILAAAALWRSGAFPRPVGIPFALGYALYIPQFYAPAAVRIAHGLLVGAGLAWVALALWRSQSSAGTARGASAQA